MRIFSFANNLGLLSDLANSIPIIIVIITVVIARKIVKLIVVRNSFSHSDCE